MLALLVVDADVGLPWLCRRGGLKDVESVRPTLLGMTVLGRCSYCSLLAGCGSLSKCGHRRCVE